MGRKLEATLAILNGTIGDYLARTGNGLATDMQLIRGPGVQGPKVVVLVHGLMCTETIFKMKDGSDYGSLLFDDLGFSPAYVRYNSGLAIPENGALLAGCLESFVDGSPVPVEELLLIGFSLGGLVVRSACHAALERKHRWFSKVRRAIYVGTPHQGAPAERAGRVLGRLLQSAPDPITRVIGDIADLRSAAIKDLGDAPLTDEDRLREPIGLADRRHPVPLLPQISHYLIAGSLSPRFAGLFGDAIVPTSSGSNGQQRVRGCPQLPAHNVKILAGIPHMSLANHPHVYAQILSWCREAV
jgi:triacylglycerol lipase